MKSPIVLFRLAVAALLLSLNLLLVEGIMRWSHTWSLIFLVVAFLLYGLSWRTYRART